MRLVVWYFRNMLRAFMLAFAGKAVTIDEMAELP